MRSQQIWIPAFAWLSWLIRGLHRLSERVEIARKAAVPVYLLNELLLNFLPVVPVLQFSVADF